MYAINCPNCGSNLQWTGSQCLECGHAAIDEEGFDLEVSDGVTIEPDEPEQSLSDTEK